jgi:hypothetical protein
MEDANEAVDFLIKGPSGWTHKFVKIDNSEICKICNEASDQHINHVIERQSIE